MQNIRVLKRQEFLSNKALIPERAQEPPVRIARLLTYLINLFNKNNIFFVVGGHVGLILQKVNIENDDEIDICTNKEGAYEIQKLLDKYTIDKVKYKVLDYFKAHWGVFKIDEVVVEVMGNPKRKFENGSWRGVLKKNIIKTKFNNNAVNVFTLKSEYEYYLKTSFSKPKHKTIANAIKQLL